MIQMIKTYMNTSLELVSQILNFKVLNIVGELRKGAFFKYFFPTAFLIYLFIS